jgi:hypothetical protein
MNIETILYLVATFIIMDLFFGFYIVFFRKKKLKNSDKNRYYKKWQEITSYSDMRAAIMDADKLVDKVLSSYGYGGSFADKLRKAEKMFSDYESIWMAHKLRNRLAHEFDVVFSTKQGQNALKQYGKALRDLKVL